MKDYYGFDQTDSGETSVTVIEQYTVEKPFTKAERELLECVLSNKKNSFELAQAVKQERLELQYPTWKTSAKLAFFAYLDARKHWLEWDDILSNGGVVTYGEDTLLEKWETEWKSNDK